MQLQIGVASGLKPLGDFSKRCTSLDQIWSLRQNPAVYLSEYDDFVVCQRTEINYLPDAIPGEDQTDPSSDSIRQLENSEGELVGVGSWVVTCAGLTTSRDASCF